MTELGERIASLRAQGMTYNQIVAETGASKGTVSYYCGAGQMEKTMQRQKDSRNYIVRYIQDVKQKSPCADCGENYPYWVMDFDHVRGEKKFNIGSYKAVVASLSMVKEEIKKCDLVCSNCHRNRTHSRMITKGTALPDISEHYI